MNNLFYMMTLLRTGEKDSKKTNPKIEKCESCNQKTDKANFIEDKDKRSEDETFFDENDYRDLEKKVKKLEEAVEILKYLEENAIYKEEKAKYQEMNDEFQRMNAMYEKDNELMFKNLFDKTQELNKMTELASDSFPKSTNAETKLSDPKNSGVKSKNITEMNIKSNEKLDHLIDMTKWTLRHAEAFKNLDKIGRCMQQRRIALQNMSRSLESKAKNLEKQALVLKGHYERIHNKIYKLEDIKTL